MRPKPLNFFLSLRIGVLCVWQHKRRREEEGEGKKKKEEKEEITEKEEG
jgi:hypothetical protein